jgi:transposase
MSPVPDPRALPDDIGELKQQIIELVKAINSRDERVEELEQQLRVLKRGLFGRKSEKVTADQMLIGFPGEQPVAPTPPEEPEEVPGTVEKAGHGRRKPPSHLPKKEIAHDLPEDRKICRTCRKPLVKIGEDAREHIEYVPSSFHVERHVCAKYACPDCQDHVVTAAAPPPVFERASAGPGLLSLVLVNKFGNHLPCNRQEEILARDGVDVSRSTMCDWIARTAAVMEPLYEAMKKRLLESRYIRTDDTPVPVQDESRDETREARLWVHVGDRDHPVNVFNYTPDRRQQQPIEFLRGFKGWLGADAYVGYDKLYAARDVVEVACWAHARRRFYDARDVDKLNGGIALAKVRKLYDVEELVRDLDDDARRKFRLEKSVPVLAGFKSWLHEVRSSILPRSPMGQAITYALNQWDALNRFLDHGMLDIDNNAAERELRPIAVGRNNWTFLGSDGGGKSAALHFSFVSTCRRHGVDPWRWYRDVLVRVTDTRPNRYNELMPDHWKALQPIST